MGSAGEAVVAAREAWQGWRPAGASHLLSFFRKKVQPRHWGLFRSGQAKLSWAKGPSLSSERASISPMGRVPGLFVLAPGKSRMLPFQLGGSQPEVLR